MKKFISISLVIFAGIVLLASCRKRDYYDEPNHDKEVAYVDYYYDDYQEIYIVQFERDNRYAIVTTLNSDDYLPVLDEQLIGNFAIGKKSIYVPDGNFYARMDVLETNIRTQGEADEALAYWVDHDPYATSSTVLRTKPKPDIMTLKKR